MRANFLDIFLCLHVFKGRKKRFGLAERKKTSYFAIIWCIICYIYITLVKHRQVKLMIQTTGSKARYCDGMNYAERAVKRLFDFLVSLVGLVLLSPLLLFIALRLHCSGGSVTYSQERIGRGGRPFTILKFRTMPSDYEQDGVPQLVVRCDSDQTGFQRFLREHHLDELPQLWNILVGDMSFVGPRPERRYFIDQIMERNPDYEYIYLMRPGLTSAATIYNGYTDTMEKMLVRLQMDLNYLQRRSLVTDMGILLTTVKYILNGKKI